MQGIGECKGLEVNLLTLGGDFGAIEQYEHNPNVWFKDRVHTYYPRIGLSVSEGLVKMGEAAMPRAKIAEASSTRIEFTEASRNTITPIGTNRVKKSRMIRPPQKYRAPRG